MKRLIAALAALILLPAAALSQDAAPEMSETEQIARTYMDAYSRVDWDAVEALMHEEIDFRDPTALGEGLGADGLVHQGREDTMEALREFGAAYNPLGLNFEWDVIFESNGRVVFMGHVNATYPTDQEGQVFRWRAAQATVLELQDGQVIRHLDFADYAHAEQGLVAEE